jgi:hypothetical protein
MNAKRLGLVLLSLTLAATGTYVFVYLYRWEWNRALVSGVLFVAAEVAIVAWRLGDRIQSVDRRLDELTADRSQLVLRRLQETAPEPRVSFAWLARPERSNVFVPVLMGAGVLLSALAWVVERVARVTARPVAEQGLAAQMAVLAVPAGGFLRREDDLLDVLRGPITTGRR